MVTYVRMCVYVCTYVVSVQLRLKTMQLEEEKLMARQELQTQLATLNRQVTRSMSVVCRP